ncbi:hypothetical protein MOZ60_08145 [Stecheria sp. CLA-KB-P133]|uniref:Uncharacterized protein n=1 Tax=Grylomicrobium aquisgranensis TaxID=2926318 RepID=A0AB35U4N1_9FIRM|nr:hypothetical protein [Stecheria sp. CLA-KB-P133]
MLFYLFSDESQCRVFRMIFGAGMGRAGLSLENESLFKDIVMMTINNSHDDYTNAWAGCITEHAEKERDIWKK